LARYCLDANVAISFLFEQDYPQVDQFWENVTGQDDLLTAPLWRAECTSVIRASSFGGRITHAQSRAMVLKLLDLPVSTFDDPRQFVRALDLAHQFRHRRAYDMQYLAVAELARAELITRDRGLRHAAAQIGVPVRFLA
jgi:predicted nucleic acid-binding protein